VEDVLASVMMKIRAQLAMKSISAITGFIMTLQSVPVGWKRARYHWNVMMQISLGDVLVASRAAITVPCMYLAGGANSKLKKEIFRKHVYNFNHIGSYRRLS